MVADLESISQQYLSQKDMLALLGRVLGRPISAQVLRRWVFERGLPARVNPLRLNNRTEPSHVYVREEVLAWLDAQFTPVPQLPLPATRPGRRKHVQP